MTPSEPEPRQRVEKTGRRRARLTPAPGADTSPETPDDETSPPSPTDPRDQEMLRDKPPHWR